MRGRLFPDCAFLHQFQFEQARKFLCIVLVRVGRRRRVGHD